jgi:hypothetical protein
MASAIEPPDGRANVLPWTTVTVSITAVPVATGFGVGAFGLDENPRLPMESTANASTVRSRGNAVTVSKPRLTAGAGWPSRKLTVTSVWLPPKMDESAAHTVAAPTPRTTNPSFAIPLGSVAWTTTVSPTSTRALTVKVTSGGVTSDAALTTLIVSGVAPPDGFPAESTANPVSTMTPLAVAGGITSVSIRVINWGSEAAP